MARGNKANQMRVKNPHQHHSNIQKKQAQCDVRSVQDMNDMIERHWKMMPDQAKTFLLGALDFLSLHKLARFWSNPAVVRYTHGGIARSVCRASWFIALNYLKLGKISKARALTLNGSFLHQCHAGNMPIETIVEMCGSDFNAPIPSANVPLFSEGNYSVQSPQTMEAYIQRVLPKESQHMMASFVKTSSSDNIMQCVDQIGDNWSGSSPANSHHKPSSKLSDDIQIQLILVNDTNKDEKHSLDIGSSTTLKTLFNDYADKRGVSLRSLRFSYNGKTLFLSIVGNKSPDELHMRDRDVITVHDTNIDKETSADNPRQANQKTTKNAKKTKNSSKRTKGMGKKRQNKQEEPVKTIEEYKVQHSKWLSKLHVEAEQQLKEIRTRLNSLDIKRQPPKQKRKNKRKKTAKISQDLHILSNPGVGGKAGKSRFMIQVGEVQNLYKTTKLSASSQHHNWCGASTLDLHGCTTEEALIKLDESLGIWVDAAMQGSYPFVIPAMIVCGCGSQILSETVEKWIKATRNVCNAPKNEIPRYKFSHAMQQ